MWGAPPARCADRRPCRRRSTSRCTGASSGRCAAAAPSRSTASRANRTSFTSQPSTAASGRRKTRAARGRRSSTASRPARSARSPSRPSDPRIVYAGSGEGLQRPDLAVGDGIYKSIDGGATWTHLGLRDGQQIASMAVDPTNPNRLFVAVLGHPYGPNAERGVYRSLDGGATFQRVLFKNENVGAFDVVLDPRDPQGRLRDAVGGASGAVGDRRVVRDARQRHLQVDRRRNDVDAAARRSAGANRTRRGRRRAQQLAASSTPTRTSKSNGDDAGALYRSDDGGSALRARQRCRRDRAARRRPRLARGRSARLRNIVYLTNTSTYRSTDGGKTMVAIKGAPGGDDYHTVWINPHESADRRARERSGRDDLRRRRRDVELVV